MVRSKILLIEDDRTLRDLLCKLLEIEGYQAVIFPEEKKADLEAFLRTESPQAILLDAHLEFSSGLDLLQNIRHSEGCEHIRVILVSGWDYKNQWKELGADGFLQKPYMPDELLQMLGELLSSSSPGE